MFGSLPLQLHAITGAIFPNRTTIWLIIIAANPIVSHPFSAFEVADDGSLVHSNPEAPADVSDIITRVIIAGELRLRAVPAPLKPLRLTYSSPRFMICFCHQFIHSACSIHVLFNQPHRLRRRTSSRRSSSPRHVTKWRGSSARQQRSHRFPPTRRAAPHCSCKEDVPARRGLRLSRSNLSSSAACVSLAAGCSPRAA